MSSVPSSSQSRLAPQYGWRESLTQWFTDWGDVVVDAVTTLGDMAIFAGRIVRLDVHCETLQGNNPSQFLSCGRFEPAGGSADGNLHRDGAGGHEHRPVSYDRHGKQTRSGHQLFTRARAGTSFSQRAMLAGRVGSAMAAVLGTMRVTEQIDALISMGANPIHYLVVPRFLACILLIPALTVMADFMGIVGGYFYSVVMLGIDHYQYLNNSRQFVGGFDFFSGIFKSFFFGGTIAVVSCYRGFHCQAGAEGVWTCGDSGVCFQLRFNSWSRLDAQYFSGCCLRLLLAARSKVVLTMTDVDELANDVAMSRPATKPLIELRAMTLQFAKQTILNNINLTIPRGQTVALIGESGCGKTMLLKSVTGLLTPTSGSMLVRRH